MDTMKLRCVDASGTHGLTFGKKYTADAHKNYAGYYYIIDPDNGYEVGGYGRSRFEVVEEEDTTTPSPTGWSSDYYILPPGACELADLIEHKDMNFNIGNIFKACYRLGGKAGVSTLYDLNKIKWFVEREIKRITND